MTAFNSQLRCKSIEVFTDVSVVKDKDFSRVSISNCGARIETEYKQSLLKGKGKPYVDYHKGYDGKVWGLDLKMQHYKAVDFLLSLGYKSDHSGTMLEVLQFDDGSEQIVNREVYEYYKKTDQTQSILDEIFEPDSDEEVRYTG